MFKQYTYIGLAADQKRIGQMFPSAKVGQPMCQDCTVDGRMTDHRYTCTRPKGHTGLHVAHTSNVEDTAAALWSEAAITVNVR